MVRLHPTATTRLRFELALTLLKDNNDAKGRTEW